MGTEIKGQIKLIVTNLDGTFLADHAALSRENIQAVQAAQEKGDRGKRLYDEKLVCGKRNCTDSLF